MFLICLQVMVGKGVVLKEIDCRQKCKRKKGCRESYIFRVAHMMMTQSNLGDCWRNWNWFHQIRPQSQQLLNRQQSYWSESVTISSVWRIISHSLWNWYHYLLLSFLILFFITLRYIQPYILLPTFYLKFGPNGNSSLIMLIGSFLFFPLLSFFSSC